MGREGIEPTSFGLRGPSDSTAASAPSSSTPGWGGSCLGKDLAGPAVAACEHSVRSQILQTVQEVDRTQRIDSEDRLVGLF